MHNSINTRNVGLMTRRRVKQIVSLGIVLFSVYLVSPVAAAPPTRITPGKAINGVLGNGADTGTFQDGTPYDLYIFSVPRAGAIYYINAVAPKIPLTSRLLFNDTAQKRAVPVQTASVNFAAAPVGYFGPIRRPGLYGILVSSSNSQRPAGAYTLRLRLVAPKPAAPPGGGGVPPAPSGTRILGFAFVNSSVTSQGGAARLPPNAKIYPSGSTVAGTAGCPTDQFGQTGQFVVAFDYTGPPVAGLLTVTLNGFAFAPIPMDVDPVRRRVQFLRQPFARNGTYVITLELLGLHPKTLTARITLARSC